MKNLRQTRRVCGLVLSALLLGHCSGGRQGRETAEKLGDRDGRRRQEAELQELLDRLRAEAGAPGGILGVSAGDGPALVVASGCADRETGRLMTPDTPYFLGSITKTYTAVTILRLAEEGRLSLDDTVARFLPSFPGGSEITVRHLLSHTSGLKDFYMYLYFRPDREEMIRLVTKRWTEKELLELAGRFGRWFDPGTSWEYSNTNYYLLGVIAERAGGVPLPEAYRRFIDRPLGLRRTWLAWHEEARGASADRLHGTAEGMETFRDVRRARRHHRARPIAGGVGRRVAWPPRRRRGFASCALCRKESSWPPRRSKP